jgi:hypothetical protein
LTQPPLHSVGVAVGHMTVQTPAAQKGIAVLHAVVQLPQCAASLRVLASQPLAGLPSQSAKPLAQA